MQVTSGAVVSINYTLTDDEGVVIDTNEGHPALVYLHGHDNIIPGLEKGLEGASAGDKRTVDVAPAEAYGEVDPSGTSNSRKEEFPDELPLEEGMQFCAETPCRRDDHHHRRGPGRTPSSATPTIRSRA